MCLCLGRAHGADDFLPVMMYVLARSNLSALQMDVEYMMELMDPTLTLGEGLLTHTHIQHTEWEYEHKCNRSFLKSWSCVSAQDLNEFVLPLCLGSYYLTTTYGALEHIKTFDQQRSATRQLSREVQDSIHRWERRRTLNQEQTGQGSVRVHTPTHPITNTHSNIHT